jgi:hypothetical protein
MSLDASTCCSQACGCLQFEAVTCETTLNTQHLCLLVETGTPSVEWTPKKWAALSQGRRALSSSTRVNRVTTLSGVASRCDVSLCFSDEE